MSVRRRGPTLPESLNEELGLKPRPQSSPSSPNHFSGGDSNGAQWGGRVLGRKDARKAARQAKRQKAQPASSSARPGTASGLKVIGKCISAQRGRMKGETRPAPADRRATINASKAVAHSASEGQRLHFDKGKSKETSKTKVQSPNSLTTSEPPRKKRKPDAGPLKPEDSQSDIIPSSNHSQRKKIGSETVTPLQRLLARSQGAASSSLSSSRSKSVTGSASTSSSLLPGKASLKRKTRSKMTQTERDEEDEIRWLEAKLGFGPDSKKRKRSGASSGKSEDDVGPEEDGLDELLDHLDNFQTGMFSDAEDEASDEEEDGADESDSSEEEDGDAVDDLDGLDDDDGSDEGAGFDLDEEEGGDEDENGIDTVYLQHFQLDSNVSASEVASSRVADGDEEEAPAIDDGGSSAVAGNQAAPQGRYIPPALRKAMEASAAQANAGADSLDDPATAGLRRQLKGLLNRMGEGNLETILTQLEGIYRFNSRAIVSETLTRLILDTITASTNLADTFVVLYAALIASLHKVIGVEFAAGFVQTLVDELLLNYDAAGRALDPYDDPQSKKALNLTSLLCELYNLQVVACPLVYDLIRHFAGAHTNSNKRAAGGITELSVELLLKIVKICGAQLRHDDPTSLRDIVDLIQQSATGTANKLSAPSTAEQSMSSRSRFMLERLADLKNAKGSASKSAAANNSAATESLNRMKKFLAGLGKKRTLRAHDLLRVTLRDLLDAERKGKWWLVGAAWTGHGDQEKDQATGVTAARPLSGSSVTAVVKERGDSEATETERTRQKLLGYARTHGMSTETRRSIFLVIMTSEDFVDAAQKLLELRLNEVQRRDIIRVLLQCLDMDEVYNPYYALIGWRLATDSHSTRFTMQYALWDFLRSIGESGVAGRSRAEAAAEHGADEDGEDVSERKLAHVARAYAWWIAKEALSLNILKTVDFTSLKPKGTLFLQLLLVNVFLSTQSAAPSLVTFVKSKDANSQPGAGDRKSLETCLLKGTAGNPDLARGLLYFLRKDLGKRDVKRILGKSAAKAASLRLTWALEVAEEILEVGASIDLAM